MTFSVLISVYIKENAKFLDRALKSIWDEQEVKPNQIVLVEDGELTDELYTMIKIWKEKLGEILDIVAFKKNRGPGIARANGVKHCKFDLIAIMDSDDIALPNRFKSQINFFKNNPSYGACGSWIGEFENDENTIYAYRKTPQTHDEILKFAKWRMPVNHPSMMFKKELILQAGNYSNERFGEDYLLCVKMLLNGAKFYNIPQILLKMRAGKSQLARRSGLKYAISELKIQREFYELGFLNFYEFVRNASVKFIIRLLPKQILAKIYSLLRSKD